MWLNWIAMGYCQVLWCTTEAPWWYAHFETKQKLFKMTNGKQTACDRQLIGQSLDFVLNIRIGITQCAIDCIRNQGGHINISTCCLWSLINIPNKQSDFFSFFIFVVSLLSRTFRAQVFIDHVMSEVILTLSWISTSFGTESTLWINYYHGHWEFRGTKYTGICVHRFFFLSVGSLSFYSGTEFNYVFRTHARDYDPIQKYISKKKTLNFFLSNFICTFHIWFIAHCASRIETNHEFTMSTDDDDKNNDDHYHKQIQIQSIIIHCFVE